MRTGLAASTVTPGSTPPDASLTTPVIAAWAEAIEGSSRKTSRPSIPTEVDNRRGKLNIALLLHRCLRTDAKRAQGGGCRTGRPFPLIAKARPQPYPSQGIEPI